MNKTSNLNCGLDEFRDEVRQFLRTHYDEELQRAIRGGALVTREQAMTWQRVLHEKGWAAPGWPREHGGPGWSLAQQAIFREEIELADCPRFDNLGIALIGPILMHHGSEAQKRTLLPRILSFEDYWAQAYSEPQAGSDLASVRTTARREGDHYVVNGSKIWQSHGQWANKALVLLRTDPSAARKQNGLSVLLVNLDLPGVTVRPIRFINQSIFHSELFFDEVRVPASCLVGGENQGWSVAKDLLLIERFFLARVAECKAEAVQLLRLISKPGRDPDAGAETPPRRACAELEIRLLSHEALWWKAIAEVEAGGRPELDASLLKLQGSELMQDFYTQHLEVIGVDGLPFEATALDGRLSEDPPSPDHVHNLHLHAFRYRGLTLGGGASEVQKEILARALFSGSTDIERTDEIEDDDRRLLLDAVRRFLAKECSFEQRRKRMAEHGCFDPAVWAAVAELGMLGLMVPASQGGFEAGVDDLVLVLEAFGESLVLEPYAATAAVALRLLRAGGQEERMAALLDGRARYALAWEEAHGRSWSRASSVPTTIARRKGDMWVLEGAKRMVPGADIADWLIVSARLEGEDASGTGLFLVPANAEHLACRPITLFDGRGAADLVFDGVRVDSSALLIGPSQAPAEIEAAIDLSCLALCADAIGAMRSALALTIEHLRTRTQFGKPLAELQVLRHRVVDHYRAWRNARALVHTTAERWSTRSATDRSRSVAATKWMVGRAARSIAFDVLQLHGAIGLQDETAISHYAKRLLVADTLFGGQPAQLTRFIELDVTCDHEVAKSDEVPPSHTPV